MKNQPSVEKIAVVGLGYVGLPLAVALAKQFSNVVGFDISTSRIQSLRKHDDWTREIDSLELRNSTLALTSNSEDLSATTFFIVTVPTPVDHQHRPNLSPIENACRLIGPLLRRNSVVVFESTVYPGVTEDFCGPLLEECSGLKCGLDFNLGYSPERINPGDKEHRLESILKIIAADGPGTLERLRLVYGSIINAGLYEAPSIKVAEAAKVLENTQRDLNIALMNEIAIIMDRMNVRTKDVLEAAGTKWNFLNFSPGLVGGHCIGVDPYYLTSAAEALGYHPQLILAGRRLNDDMGRFVATKTLKLMVQQGHAIVGSKVGILGLTFKENVPDLRNSKVPDIVSELLEFGISCLIHDAFADSISAQREYGLELSALSEFKDLDALILAVNHSPYLENTPNLLKMLKPNGVFIDVKSALQMSNVSTDILYWSL